MNYNPTFSTLNAADPASAFSAPKILNSFSKDSNIYNKAPFQLQDIDFEGVGYSDSAPEKSWIFSFNYYRRFFNVTTNEVLQRIKYSVCPWRCDYYDCHYWKSEQELKTYDLYGAVWVSLTLTLVLFFTSNCSRFLYTFWYMNEVSRPHYTIIATSLLLSLFALLMPPTLTIGVCKHMELKGCNWIDIVALNGYSLISFIFASFICLIPIFIFKWTALLLATYLAARFMYYHLKDEVNHYNLNQVGSSSRTFQTHQTITSTTVKAYFALCYGVIAFLIGIFMF